MVWEKGYIVEGGNTKLPTKITTKKIKLYVNEITENVKGFYANRNTLKIAPNGELKVTYGVNAFFSVRLPIWSPSGLIKNISIDKRYKTFGFIYEDDRKTHYLVDFDKKEEFEKVIKIFNYWGINFGKRK